MGNFALGFGGVLILAACAWWLWEYPTALLAFRSGFTAATVSSSSVTSPAGANKRVGYAKAYNTFLNAMLNCAVPLNTILTLRMPSTAKQGPAQVVGTETWHDVRHFGIAPQDRWERNGTEWIALLLRGELFEDDALLVRHTAKSYLFPRRVVLENDEVDWFVPYAQKHDELGLTAGKVSFTWRKKKYFVMDIGMYDLEHNAEGEAHNLKAKRARYMIAQAEDGEVLWIEDCFAGLDSVWVGFAVDVNKIVQRALTPTGESIYGN